MRPDDLIPAAMVKVRLAEAFRRGVAEGRSQAVAVLAARPPAPARTPTRARVLSDDRADADGDRLVDRDPLRLLAYVAATIQSRFTARGRPERAAPYLDRLAELASDPDRLGELIGGVELSWSAYEGPRGGHGWKHDETGRVVYGAHKPGDRKAARAATVEERRKRAGEAKEAADRLRRGKADPGDVETLAATIPNMTVAQLRETRAALGATLGTRWRDNMARKLMAHIRLQVEKGRETPEPLPPAEPPKPTPPVSPPEGPTPAPAPLAKDQHADMAAQLREHKEGVFGGKRGDASSPPPADVSLTGMKKEGGDAELQPARGAKLPAGWVYHNTKSADFDKIKAEGLSGGSFTHRPGFDFGGDAWLAVRHADLRAPREHQYGKVTAVEPLWEPGRDADHNHHDTFHSIPADRVMVVDKQGRVIHSLADHGGTAAAVPPASINTAASASSSEPAPPTTPTGVEVPAHELPLEAFVARSAAKLPESHWGSIPANRERNKAAFRATAGTAHHTHVAAALAAGKPVPPEVLADYPDLAAKAGPKAAPAGGEGEGATATAEPPAAAPAAPKGTKKPPAWVSSDPSHAAAHDHYARATGAAKTVMETALDNAGYLRRDPKTDAVVGFEKDEPDGETHHRYAAGLASGHRQMIDHNLGTPDDIAAVEAALAAAGAEKVDSADGGFDGQVHAAYPGVFSGHAVRVTKPGWVVRRPDGSADVVKAEVEKAGDGARRPVVEPVKTAPEPAAAAPPASPPPPAPPVAGGGAGDERTAANVARLQKQFPHLPVADLEAIAATIKPGDKRPNDLASSEAAWAAATRADARRVYPVPALPAIVGVSDAQRAAADRARQKQIGSLENEIARRHAGAIDDDPGQAAVAAGLHERLKEVSGVADARFWLDNQHIDFTTASSVGWGGVTKRIPRQPPGKTLPPKTPGGG